MNDKKYSVLFDLDGTLHSMDQEKFSSLYFESLSSFYSQFGYDKALMKKAILLGLEAMKENDGSQTNETRFWSVFKDIFGERSLQDREKFISYYKSEEYDRLKSACGLRKEAKEVVKKLREKGFFLVLASNPIFHLEGFLGRLKWAGLEEGDFDYITTFSSSSFCKPKSGYYEEILAKNGLSPHFSFMIGNDTVHDMSAKNVGIDTFLITGDSLISHGEDISSYKNGDLTDAYEYIISKTNK